MNREKLEKNIASNLTIDLDVEKYIEITLLDIEKYANQRVIEEVERWRNSKLQDHYPEAVDVSEFDRRIKELKQQICVPIMYQQKCNLYETKQGKM